jgi:hypothetical protein
MVHAAISARYNWALGSSLGGALELPFPILSHFSRKQWEVGSELTGQVTGDGRQVSDSGLASASRRELVNEKG